MVILLFLKIGVRLKSGEVSQLWGRNSLGIPFFLNLPLNVHKPCTEIHMFTLNT